jgi:hypothetical protein
VVRSIESKVVAPPDPAKQRPVALTSEERASLARCQALLREIHEMARRPVAADDPVVQRGLRLLGYRYAAVR